MLVPCCFGFVLLYCWLACWLLGASDGNWTPVRADRRGVAFAGVASCRLLRAFRRL
jgi:hypothetical protein